MKNITDRILSRLHRKSDHHESDAIGGIIPSMYEDPIAERDRYAQLVETTDKHRLDVLIRVIDDIDDDRLNNNEFYKFLRNEVRAALESYQGALETFQNLNSEEHRRLYLKRREQRLDIVHDWKEKGRLFIFRILAAILFVVMIFTIGYIEAEYEWARLPLTKYLSPDYRP